MITELSKENLIDQVRQDLIKNHCFEDDSIQLHMISSKGDEVTDKRIRFSGIRGNKKIKGKMLYSKEHNRFVIIEDGAQSGYWL
ncbi:hypothetical protein [Metabacillus niabensis]|uniref:hypothetical protein n=1 Tax=Metabacillus niabensis TaxID=324854 RepID=UPI0039A339CA